MGTSCLKECYSTSSSVDSYRGKYSSRFSLETRHDTVDVHVGKAVFRSVVDYFSLHPTLDAFACRYSAQLPRYMSWHRDQQAVAQDELISPWDPVTYLFPPVPLLPKVIRRIKDQKVRAILVCPQWPTALWWGLLLEMMVEPPMLLPHYRTILQMQDGNPVVPYLDPLVALDVTGKSFC